MSGEAGAPLPGAVPGLGTLIDASLFMGMHSTDDRVRTACKNFFVRQLAAHRPLAMTLEQVGLCDDLIWRRPRAVQDAYYPFMDNLHSELRIARFGLRRGDVRTALEAAALRDVPIADALLLAPAVHRGGRLHSVSPRLRRRPGAGALLSAPPDGPEEAFPPRLEELYRQSLALRVDLAALDRISCPDDDVDAP
ncbi:DUF6190 family protein [Streptomyces cyanogenus]|uniref:PIN domain-containing protein n=1 Tax=Streptomyces cyanogenus TaxID=80860 RepID=A0ABX7TQP3_STRCY|nr:DUF6190 family protein [Streptomyces cyanogenus]QTD97169.1 hypothetical protein S1361_07370 [Streptomyces cyanogenus]